MFFKNKYIRKELFWFLKIAIIISIAEYLIIYAIDIQPLLRLKIQIVIGVFLIAYLLRTSYRIWFLWTHRDHLSGKEDTDHFLEDLG